MLGQGQRAGASSPTWEPIVVKVAQAGDALPEVRIVGAIPRQGQLLLQGPLGNRTKEKMEHKTKQNRNNQEHNKKPEPPLEHTPIDRKHLGRITGTQTSLSRWQDESLLPGQREALQQPETPFTGKENPVLAGS